MTRAKATVAIINGEQVPSGLRFKCPGCDSSHHVYTQDTPAIIVGPRWTFDGNYDRPTLLPSVLVWWYRPTPEGEAMMNRGDPLPPGATQYPGKNEICHSFVKNGEIQFLSDCTHPLARTTVPLPEIPTE